MGLRGPLFLALLLEVRRGREAIDIDFLVEFEGEKLA